LAPGTCGCVRDGTGRQAARHREARPRGVVTGPSPNCHRDADFSCDMNQSGTAARGVHGLSVRAGRGLRGLSTWAGHDVRRRDAESGEREARCQWWRRRGRRETRSPAAAASATRSARTRGPPARGRAASCSAAGSTCG
jgi:hypothetical protein